MGKRRKGGEEEEGKRKGEGEGKREEEREREYGREGEGASIRIPRGGDGMWKLDETGARENESKNIVCSR